MISGAPMLAEMRQRVMRHAMSPCAETAIPRLMLNVMSAPLRRAAPLRTPVSCLILQGAKRVTIGGDSLKCDSDSHFIASFDRPAEGQVVAASPDRPYVAVGLALDRVVLAELIANIPERSRERPVASEATAGFATGPATDALREAWAGLIALLDRPDDVAALAPAREREVLYCLLRGPLGEHLRLLVKEDVRLTRIRKAIDWLRQRYDEPTSSAALAGIAGMSIASFHRHFRAATGMSPLQYRRSLRLRAARQMLASGMPASEAAFSVGYGSASQFSREYHRFFGIVPSRDVQLRG